MEEADHLATRVGVIADGRMLDIGTTSHLRHKHGYGFHLQLICASVPHTSPEEMEEVRKWVEETLPGAKMEGFAYHGQLRFNVPARRPPAAVAGGSNGNDDATAVVEESEKPVAEEELTVGQLFVLLEENKERLGLEFYSVSPSTFDEVFLRVIEKHNAGEEENRETPPQRKKDWKYWMQWVLHVMFLIPKRPR